MSETLPSQSQAEEAKSVLTASVRDVRFFSALLKGINFSNRASVTLSVGPEICMIVTVEEAHCLIATSYIYRDHFDEWSYTPDRPRPASSQLSETSEQDADSSSTTFEIPLTTLIECLNIFGTANMSSSSSGVSKGKRWRREDDASDEDTGDGRGHANNRRVTWSNNNNRDNANGTNRLDRYFGGSEKRTSMRLSYGGPGYPLTLLLAEDSSGPTTTCEISTFDPEPNIDLPFDGDQTVLKIIFKSSSWLRDALSELDPSCEKITFIGDPAADVGRGAGQRGSARGPGTGGPPKPLFRIKASGAFGSTEMDYPNDKEVLETFECLRPVTVSYRFAHISRTSRALQSSTKTSLRIEEEGLLSLQFLVPVPVARGGGTSGSFIEFRCMALDEDVAS
ncbi:Rad1-domain-containing protein [Gyrodon lividus]|nr:Rad1-domain-containing protein [Gyrodon lividus]